MNNALITITLVSLLYCYGASQETGNIKPDGSKTAVDFFQEEIILTVNDSTLKIDGVYHFRNNTGRDIPMPIAFPFHVDSATAYPHHIEAYLLDHDVKKQALEFSEIRQRNGIRARIPLMAGEETTWQLIYEQKISSKRAVYIITSTAAWKEPLEEATYIFVAPDDFEITYIWPEPDSSYQQNGLIYRQCVKRDFMPEQEMEIIWK